ncbi:SMP-30/gluconolactonase/LRE family protein, partial [Acinetobacter baumannii]|nr:SMP-30/gluconolactonase/LRE family protein [Acinetobacter baumannii]
LAADGAVIECSHGRRAVQIDRGASEVGAAYAPEVLVDRFGKARLNSPNDVVEKSDGTIWFTDPPYGIKRPVEGHAGEEEYGDRYVFRFDPADGSLSPVVIDVEAPNGLAFSPDESILYVSDSSISPADQQHPNPDRPRGHSIHA